MALESRKSELVLGVNVLNKPGELVGPEAWTSLILKLLFLRPGTLPSIPEAGVGIDTYDYDFIDSAIEDLSDRIPAQLSTYLPDVPVESTSVTSQDYRGRKLLIVKIGLFVENTIVTSAVAMEVKRKIIDFDISWA